MVIKSKIAGLQEWLFIEEIPDLCQPNSPLREKEIDIRQHQINMSNYQLCTGGMFILYSEMSFQQPVRIHTEVEGDTITSQFVFYRDQLASRQRPLFSGHSRHNVRYIPSSTNDYDLKAGAEYAYFLMVLSKDFYFRIIAPESTLHDHFVRSIHQGVQASFATEDMFVTGDMLRVIGELKDNKRSGELRRIHAESKISELLLYQIEQLQDNIATPYREPYLPGDVGKLEKARAILDTRYDQAPTQKALAEEVNMSESKLRQSFKDYFAVTIYDYLTRVRMEKARTLLLEERRTIAEVARLTGYNHQQNFSRAFKQYYGISPTDMA